MCGCVLSADTDAANRIAPCSDSNRIRTQIGQEIPMTDFKKWQRR